jgi:hypothetical protein
LEKNVLKGNQGFKTFACARIWTVESLTQVNFMSGNYLKVYPSNYFLLLKILLIIRKIKRITRQRAHCRPHMTWAHTHPTSRRRLLTVVQCNRVTLWGALCPTIRTLLPLPHERHQRITFWKSRHLIRPFIKSWIRIPCDIW